jgi:hypothetical protein
VQRLGVKWVHLWHASIQVSHLLLLAAPALLVLLQMPLILLYAADHEAANLTRNLQFALVV